MKSLGTYILILLLLSQVFSKWLMVLEYQVNKDFIASKLCINKEKPKLQCKGKCQLLKKMASEDKNTTSTSGSQSAKISAPDVLYDKDLFTHQLVPPAASSLTTIDTYVITDYNSPVPAIFHPPSFA